MNVMAFREAGRVLELETRSAPTPRGHEVSLRVLACAVCRTDLHIQDAELPNPRYPIVPGHQVVGVVDGVGPEACLAIGERVGVCWLGYACGDCEACSRGEENLCPRARFTGFHTDGGLAEHMLADSRFCIRLESSSPAAKITPLLCGGLIGYRSYRMAGDAERIGIYGFGSAAHLIAQIGVRQSREIFAFTRPGDTDAQTFARKLGATWAGGSDQRAPRALDAALIFAPAGELVPLALEAVRPGGRVICCGIHMSDIPSFPYASLWGERRIQSVANVTREDARAFIPLARELDVQPTIARYALENANQALDDLRRGELRGSAVVVMDEARNSTTQKKLE